MRGATVINIIEAQHKTLLSLFRADPDQFLSWQYVLLRSAEYLGSRFPGRIVLDFQAGRLNAIQNQEFIAGSTQLVAYLERIS